MGFRGEFRQLCRKCKGTGTSNKVAKDRDGNTMIADPYVAGETPRPIMQNCDECKGTGFGVYPSPSEVVVEGEKMQLSPDERRARFSDTIV